MHTITPWRCRGPLGRHWACWPVVLALALVAFAAPARGQNVSVRDYSVPVSRADNLRIDALSLNFQSIGDSIVTQSGNLGLVYKKFYESLPFAYSMDVRSSASFRRDRADDNKLKGDAVTNFSSRVKKYRRDEGNFFVFSDAAIEYKEDFDRPIVDLTPGIGFGRFINATALRKAVRIEDFLLKEGVIAERMPKQTMIELGHIIEKEAEYRELYGDRYQNYWYEDMQNEIQKSGDVLGSIGAIGVLRMQEVLEKERINERFYGWDVTAGVKVEALTAETDIARSDPAFSFGVRYSRPLSWSTQINTSFQLDTPLSKSFGQRFDLDQQTDFIYEITNKINFNLVHLLSIAKVVEEIPADPANPDPANPDPASQTVSRRHNNIISAGFSFFIENKINLTTSVVLQKDETSPLSVSLNMGMSYRIF